jgi:low affinity Fe/Cu permease
MTTTTNVDYLLQNFTINEIIDIQKKLKNDIERKKEELKQLVGYFDIYFDILF